MTPIEILKAIKEDIRDKFEADHLMMRTVNLVITEFEARSERLREHMDIKSVCLHEWDEGHNNVSKCKKCGKYSA